MRNAGAVRNCPRSRTRCKRGGATGQRSRIGRKPDRCLRLGIAVVVGGDFLTRRDVAVREDTSKRTGSLARSAKAGSAMVGSRVAASATAGKRRSPQNSGVFYTSTSATSLAPTRISRRLNRLRPRGASGSASGESFFIFPGVAQQQRTKARCSARSSPSNCEGETQSPGGDSSPPG